MGQTSRGPAMRAAARSEAVGARARYGVTLARGAAEGLRLAAAPTFAILALLTYGFGGDRSDMVCASMRTTSLLGGMVPMYGLMGVFHLTPWLLLIAGRRSARLQ